MTLSDEDFIAIGKAVVGSGQAYNRNANDGAYMHDAHGGLCVDGTLILPEQLVEKIMDEVRDPICHCGTELSQHPTDHQFVEMR